MRRLIPSFRWIPRMQPYTRYLEPVANGQKVRVKGMLFAWGYWVFTKEMK
jgi:hypothetical protein